MSTFLDHPDFWKGAALFYHADSLPYWRNRTHLPHVPAAVDDASLHDLASVRRIVLHLPTATPDLHAWRRIALTGYRACAPRPQAELSLASVHLDRLPFI